MSPPRRVCGTCKNTGVVKGLHNWATGGKRDQACWACYEEPEAVAEVVPALSAIVTDFSDSARFRMARELEVFAELLRSGAPVVSGGIGIFEMDTGPVLRSDLQLERTK